MAVNTSSTSSRSEQLGQALRPDGVGAQLEGGLGQGGQRQESAGGNYFNEVSVPKQDNPEISSYTRERVEIVEPSSIIRNNEDRAQDTTTNTQSVIRAEVSQGQQADQPSAPQQQQENNVVKNVVLADNQLDNAPYVHTPQRINEPRKIQLLLVVLEWSLLLTYLPLTDLSETLLKLRIFLLSISLLPKNLSIIFLLLIGNGQLLPNLLWRDIRHG